MNQTLDNASLSIGTESQYSATSPEIQGGGGFFDFLFGSETDKYVTSLVFDALHQNVPTAGLYTIHHALLNNIDIDMSKSDDDKVSILHLLVDLTSSFPLAKNLIARSLETSGGKNALNKQDNKGNTPAHYALRNGRDDVIDLLVEYGADLTIKNNKGYSITPSNNSSNNNNNNVDPKQNIFVQIVKQPCDSKQASQSSPNNNFESRLNNIVKDLLNSQNSANDTIGFMSEDRNVYSNKNPSNVQNTVPSDSEYILDQIMKNFEDQQGGSSKGKSMSGQRRLVTYSEISLGGASSSSSFNDDRDERQTLTELARTFENKSTEAHKRAVDRIKELLGVDENEARAYKALIWEDINASQKDGDKKLSNYDRSMELEKKASDKDYLLTITKSKVKKMVEVIENKRKERESSMTESSDTLTEKKVKKPRKIKTLESESGIDTISSF